MAYMALYRRWRPQNFDALVGQQAVKKTLINALNSGRIAHAYLFTGPRGTGKTSTARILAKALNCEQGPTAEPCGSCRNCERITAGNSMDVFEIDAASNRGIEEIKALREQLAFTPVDGRYKIYIIDEVHMLTTEAFNALLKTLEEPPAHVIFILATTDPHKIPATIHSRCQRFDFHRVTVEEITQHLALVAKNTGIDAEEEALRLIAIQAEGGMRDALSLLDQCGVMGQRVDIAVVREMLGIVGREALRELVQAAGRQDYAAALAQLHNLLAQGKDVKQVLAELAEYMRAILLFKAAPDYQEVYLTDSEDALRACAELFGQERLMAAEERLHGAMQELRGTMRPKITAELCLLDLCRQEGSTLAALAARVEQLERQLANAAAIPAAPRTQTVTESQQEQARTSVESASAQLANAVKQKTPVGGAAVKASPKAPVQTAKPAVQMSAAPVGYQGQAEVYTGGAAGDIPLGEEYWRNALELLKNEKKMAMVSCAKGGQVVAFEKNVLQVAFKAAFQCDRMNKDDYRKAFEDVFLRQTRMAIQLQCVLEGKKTVPQTKKNIPQPAVEQGVAAEELPDNLLKVKQVLGGTIQKI